MISECVYNYSMQDNLKATEQLLIYKYKRKTNLVTLLVLFLCIIGVMASIGAIINHTKNWYVGILSVVLLVLYFLVDKIYIKIQLKKQKEFFVKSNLDKVTKIKVTLDAGEIYETFLQKEKIIGTNKYSVENLTCFKVYKGDVFLIFNDENVVMLKLITTSEKDKQEFLKLQEKFRNSKKKGKVS